MEDTQSQLDELKAEKKNLAHEVTESVAKIASLEDELADEKLKQGRSSLDLQDQLDNERKLRLIADERLASLRARYEKDVSCSRLDEKKAGNDKTEQQLLFEVSIYIC